MTAPSFTFAAPASGDWFDPKDHVGHLILVKQVTAVDPTHFDDLKGANVTKVTFDYVDLDDGAANLVVGSANTHPGIAGKLTQYAGSPQMVLGRIGQAAATKQGFNPAWILEDASRDPNATAAAGAWLTAYQQRQFAPPTPPQADTWTQPGPTAQAFVNAPPAPAPAAQYAANTPVGAAALDQQQQLPAVRGMTPDQVKALIDGGMDIAAIQNLADTLNPQP